MSDEHRTTRLSGCPAARSTLPVVLQRSAVPCRRRPLPRWSAQLLALSLVFMSGSVVGCQPAGRPQRDQAATVDTAAILAAIDTLAGTVTRANNTGDTALFAATWAEDGVMSAPFSPPVVGREAIVAAFRTRPPLPPDGTLKIIPTEIRVLSAEWAYAFGVDTLTYVPAGEQQAVSESATFLVLIRKTPDGWKTYREVISPHAPPRSAQP